MIFLTLPQMYSISQDVWRLPLASLVLEADVASMKECKVMNCNFSSWSFLLEFDSLVMVFHHFLTGNSRTGTNS